MVLVRLLGPVDVMDGSGTVHPLGSARRRTLLALLAMRAGEVCTADWLLDHAWAGEPPESGLTALRFHIARLRQELGMNGLIETRPAGYRLGISPDQVDALAADERLQAARREGDRRRASDLYAEVLAMWRGEPFVDAAPCPTLDDEARRLAELRLTVTEELFRARLDAGAGGQLVADLLRVTSQNPLREALWAALITAQYRAGRQADALRSYEQLRVTLADSLGLDPSAELQQLERSVLQHDPSLLGVVSDADRSSGPSPPDPAAHHGVRHNLPEPATPLIDSADQLGSVRSLLEDHRLVTLTGTGGAGKSRLAIELAWSSLDRFADGVWLVELAPVTTADAVDAALVTTLSISPQAGSSLVDAVVDWFRGRELLLIVDNCEHLLDPVRRLLTVVLARCPTVKVVATSREPLGLPGEHVNPVTMLDPESDAVALFLDRAAAADSSFVASDADRRDITAICRRLDGLPLAIELAAARVRAMAPVDLLARLDDRFRLLRGGVYDDSGRHETLWTTVAWSYQLLTDHQRQLFQRLSVFAGSFDIRALEVICADDPADVVELLSSLVDKSMVVVDRRSDGTRYRVLETLRQFGAEQLEASGDIGEVRGDHVRHYADVAEHADNLFRTAEQVTGSEIFDREWDNIRGAHEWACHTSDLAIAERILLACHLHAVSRMRFEHGDWAERTLALGTDERPPTPDTFAQAAEWAFNGSAAEDHARSWQLLDRGIELAVAIDDPSAALCLSLANPHEHSRVPDPFHQLEVVAEKLDLDRQWWILIALNDTAGGPGASSQPAHLARLVAAAERIRAPLLMVNAASELGHRCVTRMEPPDFAAALGYYTQALAIARRSGDLHSEGTSLRNIAQARAGIDPETAIGACHAALIHLYDIRDWQRIWQLFESIGLCLASLGRIEAAAAVAGNLEAHHPPYGIENALGFRARTLDIVRASSQHAEWMAGGAAMDRFQIVDAVLAELAMAEQR